MPSPPHTSTGTSTGRVETGWERPAPSNMPEGESAGQRASSERTGIRQQAENRSPSPPSPTTKGRRRNWPAHDDKTQQVREQPLCISPRRRLRCLESAFSAPGARNSSPESRRAPSWRAGTPHGLNAQVTAVRRLQDGRWALRRHVATPITQRALASWTSVARLRGVRR